MILVQHNGRTVVKARSTQGWGAWVWCYAGSLFEDCTRVYILSGYLCVLNEQVGRNKGQQRGGSCRSASDMRRACSLFGLYVFIYIYLYIYRYRLYIHCSQNWTVHSTRYDMPGGLDLIRRSYVLDWYQVRQVIVLAIWLLFCFRIHILLDYTAVSALLLQVSLYFEGGRCNTSVCYQK